MDRRPLITNGTHKNLWRLDTPSRLVSLVGRECERFAVAGKQQPAYDTATSPAA